MKKKILYNLIGIPIIFVTILFAFSSKSEASIADFVDMIESNSTVNEGADIEATGSVLKFSTSRRKFTGRRTPDGYAIDVSFPQTMYQNNQVKSFYFVEWTGRRYYTNNIRVVSSKPTVWITATYSYYVPLSNSNNSALIR